ncbi:amidohydrolase family protein [Sphingorhabdus sp. 109]|jgi:imidazolonepropionase-like amidohydrolase|uniref:amidohydrolase family protein n=1 Tax=Sphingorhabdus sp. 109 TaxID=2653173 RepID=UPI0012F37575|nr:amidohydrolase family protein [Sphingorhabdus sp. 109]VWX61135.1 exported hypothetical protein [Sphingorhabdus sp. 109]
MRKYFQHLAAVFLLMVMATSVAAAQPFAIVDVRVFDGEMVVPKATVIVEEGVIAAIEPGTATPEFKRHETFAIVDGRGMTLLPGLLDAHYHTSGKLEGLQASVRMGVTSVFDTYTPEDKLQALRARIKREPDASYADFWSAGQAGNVPNGHGTRDPEADSIRNIDDIERWLANRIAARVDYIKLVAEPGFFPGMNTPSMDAAMMHAVTEAAHRKNLLVIAHISERKTAHWAIDAGVDIIAHPWSGGVTPAMISKMKLKNITLMSTIGVYAGMYKPDGPRSMLQDPRLRAELDDSGVDMLTSEFDVPPSPRNGPELLALVGTLHRSGIRIIVGSDAINGWVWPGVSMHRELELLVESGASPIAALHAATAAVADTFHISDRGRIAAGQRADLLLVSGDPTVDIRDTRNIVAIWKGGQRVDRSGPPPSITLN